MTFLGFFFGVGGVVVAVAFLVVPGDCASESVLPLLLVLEYLIDGFDVGLIIVVGFVAL